LARYGLGGDAAEGFASGAGLSGATLPTAKAETGKEGAFTVSIEVGERYILRFSEGGMVGPAQCHGHKVKVVEREKEPGSSDGYVYHVECSCGKGGANVRWWGILPEALEEVV
jgi:hypothetical protein